MESSDESKLFIGGLAWDTTEEKLTEYFNQYGDVTQSVIMSDKLTGRPRGFGFVVFSDPSVLDRVLSADSHIIDGRTVEAKKALSREEQQTSNRAGNYNATRSSGGGGNFKTKKIFVGGLPSTLTEDEFRQFFEEYGSVTDVVIMYDQNTQRPRGFGFITFDTEDAVDKVLHKSFHELNGKSVEVKRALPKDANPGGGGGRGGGGGYQGYNTSGSSSNSFDGRMDDIRSVHPQPTGGGFHPLSGYGAAGYGYGGNSGVGYGGYGSYGVGGYESANSGFAGPAGSYGNPNVPAGYISGAPGALKPAWSSQSPSGYGAAAPWSAPGGSVPSAPRGQSPSLVSGYGNQGYGYGNYGGSYGSYPGVYGASVGHGGTAPTGYIGGGEQQGTQGGYMGSSYGDANGNAGYSNASWRGDPSQASGGYGVLSPGRHNS